MKMYWLRELPDGTLQDVQADVIFGFRNEVWVKERAGRFSLRKKLRKLHSEVNIRDYVLDSTPTVTLLMKETPDNRLVPMVTKDRQILNDMQGIIDNVTADLQEENKMLRFNLESFFQRRNNELLEYHNHYQRIYDYNLSLIPILLQSTHQKFELFREYLHKEFSKYDVDTILAQRWNQLENELMDEYNQVLLEIKKQKLTPNQAPVASQTLAVAPKRGPTPPRRPTKESKVRAAMGRSSFLNPQGQSESPEESEEDVQNVKTLSPEDVKDLVTQVNNGTAKHERP
jgi:hypothetical protein